MKKKNIKNIFGRSIFLLIFFCSFWPLVAVAAVDPFASFLQSNIKKYTAADAEYADRPYIRKLKGVLSARYANSRLWRCSGSG